jgi:hypothetical protein
MIDLLRVAVRPRERALDLAGHYISGLYILLNST